MTHGSDPQWPNHPASGGRAATGAAEADAARRTPPAIRIMTTADIPGGLRLCRASGWNQVARDWAQFLALGPEAARVAERDDRIVGSVATMNHDGRFAWIGMVLVDPGERGRGLGTLLVRHALEIVADLPAVRLDATPAGHGLYVKLGFREEYRLSRMQATIPAGLAAPAGGRIRRMGADDLEDVIAFDQRVFGANRAAMLRWMWEGAPDYAWISRRDRRIDGFALGRHGFLFDHLGPVVAVDAACACELATACLAPHADREFIVDVARHAPDWLRRLEAIGFREQRFLIRMCRGEASGFGDPSRQFAVLGPEFG
jgi:ribosomal protein S18 acetylase RimI-like enzyme